MTHQQLHDIPRFTELFQDIRFKSALVYLRANFPNRKAALGEEWRGYYNALDELEKLENLPTSRPAPSEPSLPYTTKPFGNQPENKS